MDNLFIIERERLLNLTQDIKILRTEYYLSGNFCDAQSDKKEWCIAEVLEKNEDKIKIIYYGSNTNEEELIVSKTKKISPFRKFTKGYTGPINLERSNIFKNIDVIHFLNLLKHINQNKIESFEVFSNPLEVTQVIRGKIFYLHDLLMTDATLDETSIVMIFDIFNELLNFSVNFFIFLREHLYIGEILEKHYDLYLIDPKCALFACYYEIIDIVKKIFGYDSRTNRFFKECGNKPIDNTKHNISRICKENCYKPNFYFREDLPAIHFANLVDYFHHKNGFNIIFEIIYGRVSNTCKVQVPFYLINILLKVIQAACPFIDMKNFFDIESLVDYLSTRILNMTEPEIKDTESNDIFEIAYSIKALLISDEVKASNFSDEFILNYMFKCFDSKYLEKRIKGITYITRAIDLVTNKDTFTIFNQEAESNSFKHYTTDHLFEWIKSKGIIQIILGEHIHEEILKRSHSIFLLFAKKNSIHTTIYDLMFKSMMEKHETIANQIRGILCDLALDIAYQDKEYLFNKVKNIPSNCYDENFLHFIKNLTINCLKPSVAQAPPQPENKHSNLYGLPIFWKLMQDGSQFILISSAALCQIFSECDIDQDVINHYIVLCLDNIKDSSSIVQSLKLLQVLIQQTKNSDVIQNMDKTISIVSLVVKDTQKYLHEMNSDSKGKSEVYNHMTNLETRLNFIVFVLKFSFAEDVNLKFSFEDINQLWSSLILNKSTSDLDKNIFYRFLIQINQLGQDISDDIEIIISDIYFKLITNPINFPPERINYIGVKVFSKYFNYINQTKNNLIIFHRRVKVCNSNLLGYETIWNILTNCPNETVQTSCVSQLCELFLNPLHMKEDLCTQIWTKFMNYLIDSMDSCVNNNKEVGIKGIISLLKTLTQELNSEGDIPRKEDLTKYSNTFPLTFTLNGDKKIIQVGINEFVAELRDKISYYFDIPLQNLIFKVEGKIISSDEDVRLVRELLSSNQVIEIQTQPNPLLSFNSINPREMIMNNKFILDTLFSLLLNSDALYMEELWELINILPKNKELENFADKLGKEKLSKDQMKQWSIYFDFNSIYKLSYSLKIIKEKIGSNYDWLENFRLNQGLNYMIELLINFTESSLKSQLGFKCINDILLIISSIKDSYIMFHDDEISTKALPTFSQLLLGSINSHVLLRKLFEIIYFIFLHSMFTDNDPKLIEIQTEHTKRRTRELMQRLYNKKNETTEDIDEVHETIRDIWNMEVNSAFNILSFMDNFDSGDVVNFLIQSYKLIDTLFTTCLIIPKNARLKMIFYEHILQLVKSSGKEEFYCSLYNRTLNLNILHDVINYPANSDHWFHLLLLTLSHHKFSTQFETIFKSKLQVNLFEVTDHILAYITQSNLFKVHDNIIVGYMLLLREFILSNSNISIYVKEKGDLISILLEKCLFTKCLNSTDTSHPLCNSSSTRRAGYKLLVAISTNVPLFVDRITNILTEFHKLGYWRSKRNLDWNLTDFEDKSVTGYTGIKNLGCICYMNCLLQQFYMIPMLREGILSSPDRDIFKQDESVLFHLKQIFASLKASDRQFHNPKHFCSIFKNFEGQVMNVLEQMDVDEFFNLLIDRLEPYLSKTSYENIFKYHFGGVMSNELICKGCPHYSERKESFNSISLQVKEKKSIQESLETMVEGEMLMGDNAYLCEICNKKVDTVRRQCIKNLPRVLVLVLRRFEFNYDTMTKLKVNDYCEFPFELDMLPYTQDYLNGKNTTNSHGYTYDLSGVIIHIGTSESGHYYSIIKSDKGEWLEFNDTIVTQYDINDLPSDAYGGGTIVKTITDVNGQIKKISCEKNVNAYVLFYTKKLKSENNSPLSTDVVMQDVQGSELREDTVNPIDSEMEKIKMQGVSKYSNIQSNILSSIKSDNYQFWVGKIIFSYEYSEFIQDLVINYNTTINALYSQSMITKNMNSYLYPNINRQYLLNSNIPIEMFIKLENQEQQGDKSLSNEYQLKMFRFLCYYFFTTGIRCKDRSSIPKFLDMIKANINFRYENAEWILEEFSNHELISEFLVDCSVNDMKKFTVGIIYCAMLKISSCLSDKEKELISLVDVDTIKKYSLTNFIEAILFLVVRKHKNFIGKDFTFLYLIIWRFAQLGQFALQFLTNINYLQFYFLFVNTKNNLSSLATNQPKLEENLKSILREPAHKELNIKTLYKNEKLTYLEEMFERKQAEKSTPSEVHLLMTASELIRKSNVFDKSSNLVLSESERKILTFEDSQLIKILLIECKSWQGSTYIRKLIKQICLDDNNITNWVSNAFIDLMNQMEFSDLDIIMRLFLHFVTIEDNIKDQRISSTLSKYFNMLMENLKYYKFIEYNIDFIITLYLNFYHLLESHIEGYTGYFINIIKWLKENPYPPYFQPSKTTQLFKKKPWDYSKINMNASQRQQFMNINKQKSDEKCSLLFTIAKKNVNQEKNFIDYEEDLSDFKFSINDLILYNDNECVVRAVLDEMIQIEFVKRTQQFEWVDTSMPIKILRLDSAQGETS